MLLFIILFCQQLFAAAYDPKLTWRVLETPHFRIHFHGGEEQLAQELADMAEEIFVEMSTELLWEPSQPTQVVLVDNTDSANGYATYLPMNTIVIFVTAPEGDSTLSLYENWNDAIFTHELTHILHIDTVSGIPKSFRTLFGKIIAINGLAPGWIIEGQATLQETRHTNAGRGRASIPDMIKRIATLEDDFPPLGNMEGYQAKWPRGNLRYLFGQDFMQYVSDHYGEKVWTDWNHQYGGGIPYLLPDKKALGKPLHILYEEWKQKVHTHYEEVQHKIEQMGQTEFTILTSTKQNCMGGRLSPDGTKLVYACNDPETGGSIYLANEDGSEAKIEKRRAFSKYFSWRKDSQAYAYSGSRIVNRFNLFSDVYLRTLSKGTQMLTRGKRARDPVFDPTGTHLLVVTNELQNNQLATLTVDQSLTTHTSNTDHTQYSHPRYSPDGARIAVSVWHNGQRDIWLYTPQGTPVRRITHDHALDIHPTWSSDGKTLYFSSDRSGIFNIYAIDLSTEIVYRLTNVLSGAFSPSIDPSEENMVFTYYHNNGFGIARMPISRESWTQQGSLPISFQYQETLIPRPPATPVQSKAKRSSTEIFQGEAPSKSSTSEPSLPLISPSLQYDGLTALHGPFQYFTNQKGYWGLPHEQPSWNDEGPGGGPSIEQEISVDNIEDSEEQSFAFRYPVNRYNPLPSLLPPRFISPGIYSTTYGLLFAAGTSGTDILRRHLYSASTSYRTDSGFIGWGLSYAYNRHIPIYSFGVYSYTVPYGSIYTSNPPSTGTWIPSVEETTDRYWDKRIRAYAQVSYAMTPLKSIFARWTGTHRSPWVAAQEYNLMGFPIRFGNKGLPENTHRPSLPTRGFLSSIGGGWRYVRGSSYAKSISPENTRLVSIVGEAHSPLIGSFVMNDDDQLEPFSQLQFTAEWREYRTLPWANNHVLAIKGAAGIGAGSIQRYGAYRLGGSFGESGYYTLPDEWRALRGYTTASRSGNSFYLGSAEYRLPIVYLDRGFRTWPIFLRNLSASAFVDVGHAFDDVNNINQIPMLGMGAELTARIIISWGQPLSIRSGYAFSPLGDGIPFGNIYGFYSWLGGSF